MTEGQANALYVLLKERGKIWEDMAANISAARPIDKVNAEAVMTTFYTAARLVVAAMDGLLDERVYRKETPERTAD